VEASKIFTDDVHSRDGAMNGISFDSETVAPDEPIRTAAAAGPSSRTPRSVVVHDGPRRTLPESFVPERVDYRDIVEHLVLGVYQSTPDGRFRFANAAFARMLGYDDVATLVTEVKHIDDLYFDPEFRKRFMAVLDVTNTAHGVDYPLRRRDGSTVWIRVNVRTIRNADGAVEYFEGVAEDITSRKVLEAELDRLTGELRRSNDDLARFASELAHDLRNPAVLVEQWLALLLRKTAHRLDRKSQRLLGEAQASIRHMRELIGRLLDFSRVGGACRDVVAPAVAIENALAPLRPELERIGGRVEYSELPMVIASDVLLERLFGNLFANALKYRGKEPLVVTVDAVDEGTHFRFRVADNGLGFEPHVAPRLFELFYRAHDRKMFEGAGMGLYFCRRIVERLGGKIWAESLPDRGAAFFFTLPKPSGAGLSTR
jgi:PAS domain S-box-containing protein